MLFLFLFAIGFISLNYLLIVAAFDILKLIKEVYCCVVY